MRRLVGLLVLIAGVFFFAIPDGAAQPKGKGAAKKDEKKETVLDFNAAEVEAQFLTPAQGVVETVKRTNRSSLIRVRTDFVDEVKKSAEDL